MSPFPYLIILTLTSTIISHEKYKQENGVIILNDQNFLQSIADFNKLMILFYAPWCGHCKKLLPEYEKASNALKKEKIALAKIDAESNRRTSQMYGIESYPTIKVFIKQKEYTYDGERNEESIIYYMRKMSSDVLIKVNNTEQADKILKENYASIILFGNDQKIVSEFEASGRVNRDINFIQIDNDDVIKYLNGTKDTISIYKSDDNEWIQYNNDIYDDDINDFIDLYAGPKIYYWDESGIKIVFQKNKPSLFFFADPSDDKYNDYEKLLNELHPKIFKKVKIVMLNNKDGEEKRISDFIGVKDSDLPCVKIIHSTQYRVKKYSLKKEINESNIIEFVNEFSDNKLIPELKSENKKRENNGPILYITGKSFKEDIMNQNKDVLLKIFAPWCEHCKELEPIYKKLAEDLKNNNHLILAESDGTLNEFEEFDVFGYPSLIYIPGNKKSEEDFAIFPEESDRTYNTLLDFIKKHSTKPIVIGGKNEGNKGDL